MKKLLLITLIIFNVNYLFADSSPFDFVVALDESGTHRSIQAAIDDCPDGERKLIFIKNGIYEEQITIGNNSTTSAKLISLIGESMEGVVITHNDYRTSGANGNGKNFYDVITFLLNAKDFYAENITIENKGRDGQAEVLATLGDRHTFKNCQLLGYQDTYRGKKRTRCYFKDSKIEGRVDFIYAGGVTFFDHCLINCIGNGSYIVAPEDSEKNIIPSETTGGNRLRFGFFFLDCELTANEDVAEGSCYLGRPWKSQSGTYYLNCKMGNHINPAGWAAWDGAETTASFAEYESMDLDGNLLDVSKRVDWSFQLVKEDVDDFLYPAYVYDLINSAELYDPISIVKGTFRPDNFTFNANSGELSWDKVEEAVGYLLYKDGEFLAATNETSYTDTEPADADAYTIKTMSEVGVLSEALKVGEEPNSISTSNVIDMNIEVNNRSITWDGKGVAKLYNLSGAQIVNVEGETMSIPEAVSAGLYILHISIDNSTMTQKIIIN